MSTVLRRMHTGVAGRHNGNQDAKDNGVPLGRRCLEVRCKRSNNQPNTRQRVDPARPYLIDGKIPDNRHHRDDYPNNRLLPLRLRTGVIEYVR